MAHPALQLSLTSPHDGLLGFFGTDLWDLWDMHLLWNMSAHIKNVVIWETVRCFSAWALFVSCAHPLGGDWFHSCIFPPIIHQQQWAGCHLRQAQPSILYQFLSFLMVVTSPSRLSLFKFCLVLASPCIFILFFQDLSSIYLQHNSLDSPQDPWVSPGTDPGSLDSSATLRFSRMLSRRSPRS